jgi:hypothetical protein
MEQAKHTASFTPGPWVADKVVQLEGRSGSYQQILDGPVTGMGSNILAWVCVAHPYNHDLQESGSHNARLIAAAPELLAVLQKIAASDFYVSKASALRTELYAAIAKATGSAL